MPQRVGVNSEDGPLTARKLFESFEIPETGTGRYWVHTNLATIMNGKGCNKSGVYIIALPEKEKINTNIIKDDVKDWLRVACKKEFGIKIPTEYQEVSANIQEKVKNFWIPGTDILFIGRATIRRNRGSSIKMRVRQLRAHRIGNKSPHKEGQLIKLIPDWYKLVVYYYPTEDRHFEKKMISAFRSKYHKPPFANVKYWTKSKSAGKWNEYSRF